MLTILRFKIIGFQHQNREVELIFAKDQVSVIYGDNGCGKTTFLKLLFAALNQQESALLEESVQQIFIDYTDHEEALHSITIGLLPTNPDIPTSEGGRYDWRELISSPLGQSKSLSIGIERGVATQPVRIEPAYIHKFLIQRREYARERTPYDLKELAYELSSFLNRNQAHRARTKGQELDFFEPHVFLKNIEISNIEALLLEQYRLARAVATEKIQTALFDTLASVIEQDNDPARPTEKSVREISGVLVKSKERITEALGAGPENRFKSQVIQTLAQIKKEEDVEPLLRNEILAKLIINMVAELQVEKQLLSSINLLIDTFNEFLTGGKKLEIENNELTIKINTSKHSVDYLSSGERHILTFLALILTVGRGRNFLIIDEPEISLNIKWQRILLNILKELVPGTQIIAASHSPIISKNRPDSLVKLQPKERVL